MKLGPILLLAGLAQAQDDDWGDEADDVGFGDFSVTTPEAPAPTSPFSGGGLLQTNESLWVERLSDAPLARARQSLDLWGRYKRGSVRVDLSGHAEIDLPYWIDRERWDDQTFETYAWQVAPQEALVAVSAGPFEVTAGRQLIVWGEGLMLSPVDVVAARDLRDPGLADLEDLRLPVTALQVGWFPGAHRLELTWVPEFDIGYPSTPAGPYGPIDALISDNPLANDPLLGVLFDDRDYAWRHRQDRWDPKNQQGFARWRYSGAGVDLGLYAATLLDKTGNLSFPDTSDFIDTDAVIRLPIVHRRYAMLGHSGTATAGPLLLRWEAALDIDRAISTYQDGDLEVFPPIEPEIGFERTDLVNLMGGVQYTGVSNLSIDLELAGSAFTDKPAALLYPVGTLKTGFRMGYTAMRERLVLSATGLGFGEVFQYGGLVRVDASYEIVDGVHGTLGGIVYRPGSERGFLLGLDTHDQLFVQGSWHF